MTRFMRLFNSFAALLFLLIGSARIYLSQEPMTSSDYLLLAMFFAIGAGFFKGIEDGENSQKTPTVS